MLLVPVSEMLAESWLYSCNQERECRIRRRAKGPVYLPVLPVRRYPGGSHPDLLDAGTSRCVMPWSGEWKFGRVAPYKKCEPNCSCGIEDLRNAEFRTNELSRIMRAMRGRR